MNVCNISTTVLVGLTGHTNDIEWMQYSHYGFSVTHRTQSILNGCNILTTVLVGLTGHTNEGVQYSHYCLTWTHRTHK